MRVCRVPYGEQSVKELFSKGLYGTPRTWGILKDYLSSSMSHIEVPIQKLTYSHFTLEINIHSLFKAPDIIDSLEEPQLYRFFPINS